MSDARPPAGNGRRLAAWLPLALVAITFAVAWGANKSTVSEHERRIQRNEKAVEQLLKSNERLDERTKRTGDDVKEIKNDVKSILREFQLRSPTKD